MRIGRLFRHWTYQVFAPGALLRAKYNAFRELLDHDEAALDLLAQLEEIHYGGEPADWSRVVWLCRALRERVSEMVRALQTMNPSRWLGLSEYLAKVDFYVAMAVELAAPDVSPPFALPLDGSLGPVTPSVCGNKAARLAEAAREGIPVPPGVSLTATAYHYFMDYNELREPLEDRLRKVRLDDPDGLEDLCGEMRTMIMAAAIPPALREALRETLSALGVSADPGEFPPKAGGPLLAVRSSAVGEDGEASFAGQFHSELNVPPRDIERACRRVIAAKYSPRAVTYRILHGLADVETPMAVLIMPMVDASAGGVAYSSERPRALSDAAGSVPDTPAPPTPETGTEAGTVTGTAVGMDGRGSGGKAGSGKDSAQGSDTPEPAEELRIYAVSGSGSALADGRLTPWRYRFTRAEKPELLEVSGPKVREAAKGASDIPYLELSTVRTLARHTLALESLFSGPQDVEWAVDRQGEVAILQSRPLQAERPGSGPRPDPGVEPLISGGARASGGAACGTIVHAGTILDVSRIPEDAVLVVPTLTPALARLVRRVVAVVAASGSRASHFASVAREFGLPVTVIEGDIFSALPEGSGVTVDATQGAVYPGCLRPIVEHARVRRQARADTPLARRMKAVMPRIGRLTLTDPSDEKFTPEKWYSLHDIIRFAHEKGVAEMFSLVGRGGRGLSGARRLKSDIPLVLYLLDLEGGLFETAGDADEVGPDDIQSLPMSALWWGLSTPDGFWPAAMPAVDWEELDRVSAGIFSKDARSLASYAVFSLNYLHLMLRFGYHFAVVDSFCASSRSGDAASAPPTSDIAEGGDENGPDVDSGGDSGGNYVHFRFKGGGAGPDRRLLRIRVLERVLGEHGFTVNVTGDMLDATFSRHPQAATRKALAVLGYVLACTRMLDMRLESEDHADSVAGEFLDRIRNFTQGGD